MSPYDCVQAGGDFLGLSSTCPTTNACDRKQHFGVGMSQVAARRLLREGVVHTLLVNDHLAVYQSEHPMWMLVNYGVVIAPEIRVGVHEAADPDPAVPFYDSAVDTAYLALARAAVAMSAFETAHPGKPFHWSLHISGLGAGWTWQLAENSELPIFTHHEDDVADSKLPRRKYIDPGWHHGHVGDRDGDYVFAVHEQEAPSPWSLLGQFSEDYYLEPWPAAVTITDFNSSNEKIGERHSVVSRYDPEGREFTLADPIVTPASGTAYSKFTITRRSDLDSWRWQPCYFFKHGAEEMGNWVQAFCAHMANEENWQCGLPPPAAVIISDEDIGEASIDWENYKDYLSDSRASNSLYTIDGERTLSQWHIDFRTTEFDVYGNYSPDGPDYSPDNEVAHSYLLATLQTAYNYHREQSTWQHFRALWPKARLSQYQLGNGYGVGESIVTAVPIGPGESSYHGLRGDRSDPEAPGWKGPVSWDEYICGLTNSPTMWDPIGDGQVIPIAYNSADCARGTALAGSAYDEVPVDFFGPPCSNPDAAAYDLTPHVGSAFPVYVEFLAGSANPGITRKATAWPHGVLTLDDPLPNLTTVGDEFFVYFPTVVPYVDYVANSVDWPLIETFCDRYGEDVDAAGFKATAKKWAAECARAQTRALPDNPYSVYYAPGRVNGDYDGQPERVSTAATYPTLGFECPDGWMSGADWGEIGSQAINYGVNHFVWFMPELVDGCDCPVHDDCLSMWALTAAICTMDTHLYENLPVYVNIACIGDWDMDGTINTDDATAFLDDLNNEDRVEESDLNNDGEFDQGDIDVYNSMFCGGGCAPVDDPGCTNLENCNLVDWTNDGYSGVEDLFAFLLDWFEDANGARSFGGEVGVEALFAFLTMWFTVGIGPCDP